MAILNNKPAFVRELMSEYGFDLLLDSIDRIDFVGEFNYDTPNKISMYKNLEQCLRSEEFDSKRAEIKEQMNNLEPKIEDMIIISILNLISIMEVIDFRIGVFEDGVYRLYSHQTHYWKRIDDKIINHLLIAIAEKSGIPRKEILRLKAMKKLREHFDEQARIITPEAKPDVATINLRNGTFVVSPDFIGLREHRYSDYNLYILDFDYDATAQCPSFESFIEKALPENNARLALAELFAYPLARGLKLEKAGVLQGPGGTGKSTLAEIIISIYGEENVCSYTLSNLCSNSASSSYNRADLKNYMFNYSSEMGSEKCEFNLVKKLISREPIEARYPYGKPFILRDYCPTFFNVNNLPLMENTSAYWRRFMAFPFCNVIADKNQDIDFAKKIIERERPGILNWILSGLTRLMSNKRITYSQLCEDTKKRLRRESDSVISFIDDMNYEKSTTEFTLSREIYVAFCKYCEDSNLHSLSRNKFYNRLTEIGIKVDRNVPNHEYRVYCTQRKNTTLKNYDNDITKMFGLSDSDE